MIIPLGRRGTRYRNHLRALLFGQLARCSRPWSVLQSCLDPFLDTPLPNPADRAGRNIQRIHDLLVLTSLCRLQQNPGPRLLPGRALSLVHQGFQFFSFLRRQGHSIFDRCHLRLLKVHHSSKTLATPGLSNSR
jgi:hypothetical protein